MGTELLSLGLDVGTTTTQLIFSRLSVENCAGSFSVPRFEITGRKILYESDVYFTPLKGNRLVDGDAIKKLVEAEYRKAGINKEDVDTGAVIITGETSRKENAAEVLRSLSGFAGDFVAATAGPDLESILAAKGAGAVEFSKDLDKPVLHIDIGGGTSNLALIKNGKILRTGCLNVGGRLVKHQGGAVTYVSAVLEGIRVGDAITEMRLRQLGALLCSVLEMAAGLAPVTERWEQFLTKESTSPWVPPKEDVILSFSGGVAACIAGAQPMNAFGDLGPALGDAIRKSRLCKGDYRLGADAIRATVIGAGSHSAQLSGSTVFAEGVCLPLKNIPVIPLGSFPLQIPEKVSTLDTDLVILSLPDTGTVSYTLLCRLAEEIAAANLNTYLICTGSDIAKALGQKLRLLRPDTPCLCIDGIYLTENAYLDIGAPVGTGFPVVVKTLILDTM